MRIEDSVCVQEEHPLVLTTEAVKEVCFVVFFYFLVTFSYKYLSLFGLHHLWLKTFFVGPTKLNFC